MKMNTITKRLTKSFILTILLSISFLAFSQNSIYLGKEKNIDNTFLLKKAETTNFNGNLAAKIYTDEKNSYYAVDLSKFSSRYEKIRVLEFTYKNRELINIYNDINGKYLLFLVNNTLNLQPSDVIDKLNRFKTEAEKEKSAMNEEEMKLWLKQHDKYIKKL